MITVPPTYDAPMTARKIFADLLRGYREQAGWTRAEAAPRLSLSESLLEKMERILMKWRK
jgi:ribosome-binding protein aMBF1 (putative translation factor)